jgi:hypothetical protein
MKPISSLFTLLLAAFLLISVNVTTARAGSEAHAHIGHVVSSWPDTPSKRGLLPTAMREALVAAAHANYAASAMDDLETMKMHTHHVRHAIDPSLEAGGPGMGYGLIKAAEGAIENITYAAQAADASEAVKTHTVHVVTSLQNAVERSKQALVESDAVLAATTAAEALPHVTKMAELTKAALIGVDADGDGNISWKKGEGGLKTADQHMGYMLKAEGMSR